MQDKPDIVDVKVAVKGVDFIGELGEGGFKVAYRANVKGNEEAVKLVRIPIDPKDPTVEEENRRRLRRELEILGTCQCSFLVKLGSMTPFDCRIGPHEYVCYSEELVKGEHLGDRIQAKYIPPQEELAVLGSCLLSAVKELASINTVHRDIKPVNIIATSNQDRPFVLLDLGIAFIVGGTNLTRDSRSIPGTRYYLAPEMLEIDFRRSLDYRADLYAIGLTIYEYASCVNPFLNPGDPPETTLLRIKHQNPQPLSTLRGDLNRSFCALVDQLIKKLPALRPASLSRLSSMMEGFK